MFLAKSLNTHSYFDIPFIEFNGDYMIKKIARAYLISILILIILSISYSLFLYFTQNEKMISIITLIIGVIFFFILGLLGIKAFKKRLIFVAMGYFFVTYRLFIIIFFLLGGDFTYKIIIKGIICLISTFVGCLLGKN